MHHSTLLLLLAYSSQLKRISLLSRKKKKKTLSASAGSRARYYSACDNSSAYQAAIMMFSPRPSEKDLGILMLLNQEGVQSAETWAYRRIPRHQRNDRQQRFQTQSEVGPYNPVDYLFMVHIHCHEAFRALSACLMHLQSSSNSQNHSVRAAHEIRAREQRAAISDLL